MVGIAIINYNTYEKTIECISSIRKNTFIPYRIYLLDNASTNDSRVILEKEYAECGDITFIASSENLGYARGNNLCIDYMEHDGCDYCVISNNDILCHKKSIDMLYYALTKQSDYAIVAPKIKGINGEFQNSFKIEKNSKIQYLQENTYLANFYRDRINCLREKHERIENFTRVYWVSGAFFMADLKKFKQIGCFDPYTFLFYEESILSHKCQKIGYKIGYLPLAEVTHFHAVSTGGGVNIVTKTASFRSELYYWKKYENVGRSFLQLLRFLRILEVVWTFGKRHQFKIIKEFLKDSRNILHEINML